MGPTKVRDRLSYRSLRFDIDDRMFTPVPSLNGDVPRGGPSSARGVPCVRLIGVPTYTPVLSSKIWHRNGLQM